MSEHDDNHQELEADAGELEEIEEPTEEPEPDLENMDPPQAVAHLAALQFSRDQIATIVGEAVAGTELEAAYQRGMLLGEAKVRFAIMRLAMAGSSPAQAQYLELIRDRQSQDRAGGRGGRR